MKARPLVWFLGASLLACAWVFGPALWGGALLAPLDLAPALFSKYRFVDPRAPALPANHHIIDQLTYDLPLQRTIHAAVQRGEWPWWDPYTYAGRPLLADAHISGTDPVRLLLYRALPFVAAYNWTRVVHALLTGLGLFLLLQHARFRPGLSVLLALAYQCGGSFTTFFGHPWIQASFVYYPLLWLAWARALERDAGRWSAVGGLLVAGALYAGNLQSHAYLPLLASAFALGYAGGSAAAWTRVLPILLGSGVVGAALAAPLLLGQLEFFRLGVRSLEPGGGLRSYLSGVLSLSGVFPWALGTFRTLDAGKVVGESGLGFRVFVGSIAFVLALIGLRARPVDAGRRALWRTAALLVGLYGLVLSTPLLPVLYTRCAALAALGLIVLAAVALHEPLEDTRALRAAGWATVALAGVLAVGLNLGALVVYPRFQARLEAAVLQRDAANVTLDAAPGLRQFQVRNFPNEVSFRNPEVLVACAGLALVGFWLVRPSWRAHSAGALALLALNLIPVLLFSHRFIPRHPLALWERLLAGGPAQQAVLPLLAGQSTRLEDVAPGMHEQLFPHAFPHFYQVRSVHGYSALQPRSLYRLPAAEQAAWADLRADFTYHTEGRGAERGVLSTNRGTGLVRFVWEGPAPRAFRVETDALNRIVLAFAAGPAGTLLWTDTRYPGWQARLEGQPVELTPAPPTCSRIALPAGATRLELRYRPSGLRFGWGLAAAGGVVGGWLAFKPRSGAPTRGRAAAGDAGSPTTRAA